MEFDVKKITEENDYEKIKELENKLKYSRILSKVFLYVCYLLEQKKTHITCRDITGWLGKSPQQCRGILEQLNIYDVLKTDPEIRKGKTRYYFLNRDIDYYKRFIPFAEANLKEEEKG